MTIAQEWKQEGMQQGMQLVAQSMLLANQSIEKIMRYTGLSADEIEQLQS